MPSTVLKLGTSVTVMCGGHRDAVVGNLLRYTAGAVHSPPPCSVG